MLELNLELSSKITSFYILSLGLLHTLDAGTLSSLLHAVVSISAQLRSNVALFGFIETARFL